MFPLFPWNSSSFASTILRKGQHGRCFFNLEVSLLTKTLEHHQTYLLINFAVLGYSVFAAQLEGGVDLKFRDVSNLMF